MNILLADSDIGPVSFFVIIAIALFLWWICSRPDKKEERIQHKRDGESSNMVPPPKKGLRDKNGNILSENQEYIAKKCYEKYITPTIRTILDASESKRDFSFVIESVSIPSFKTDVNSIEYEVLAGMIGIVGTELTIQCDGVLELSPPSIIWEIADDMLGRPEHDFKWLYREKKLRWRGYRME